MAESSQSGIDSLVDALEKSGVDVSPLKGQAPGEAPRTFVDELKDLAEEKPATTLSYGEEELVKQPCRWLFTRRGFPCCIRGRSRHPVLRPDPQTTLRIYAHYLDSRGVKAMSAVNKMVNSLPATNVIKLEKTKGRWGIRAKAV